jgi:hypothetical protein
VENRQNSAAYFAYRKTRTAIYSAFHASFVGVSPTLVEWVLNQYVPANACKNRFLALVSHGLSNSTDFTNQKKKIHAATLSKVKIFIDLFDSSLLIKTKLTLGNLNNLEW